MGRVQALLSRSSINPSIGAGDLVHSVTILAPSTAADDYGRSVVPQTWSTVRTARAAIYTAGGRETSQAAQLVSDVSHVVVVRWTADVIEAGFRVQFGSRLFTIQYAENVLERNRVLQLYCLEVDGSN